MKLKVNKTITIGLILVLTTTLMTSIVASSFSDNSKQNAFSYPRGVTQYPWTQQ